MLNRIAFLLDGARDPPPAADYWVIVARDLGPIHVTRHEAVRVATLISGRFAPRWVRFADLFGADVRLLASTITAIGESTEAQRRQARAFGRARAAEEEADDSARDGDG